MLNKKQNRTLFYIFFLSFFIFFIKFSTGITFANTYKITELEITEPYDINFDKDKIIDIAFQNAYKKRPDIKLHKYYDGSHPDILGTYLAACVLFSSITNKSPINIRYDYFGKINSDDKLFLQNIAHKTVEDFFNIKLK